MTTSLLLVGGCELDHRGLSQLLAGSEIAMEEWVSSGRAALSLIARRPFHIVLIDSLLSDYDAIDLMLAIREVVPRQCMLLIGLQENPAASVRGATLGAVGFVSKSDSSTVILTKLRNAVQGNSNWSREDLRRLGALAPAMTSATEYAVPLTHRETDVLKLLSDGQTNKQISQTLGISYETVKEHVQHVLHKIGVTDRSQAAVWAVRQELF